MLSLNSTYREAKELLERTASNVNTPHNSTNSMSKATQMAKGETTNAIADFANRQLQRNFSDEGTKKQFEKTTDESEFRQEVKGVQLDSSIKFYYSSSGDPNNKSQHSVDKLNNSGKSHFSNDSQGGDYRSRRGGSDDSSGRGDLNHTNGTKGDAYNANYRSSSGNYTYGGRTVEDEGDAAGSYTLIPIDEDVESKQPPPTSFCSSASNESDSDSEKERPRHKKVIRQITSNSNLTSGSATALAMVNSNSAKNVSGDSEAPGRKRSLSNSEMKSGRTRQQSIDKAKVVPLPPRALGYSNRARSNSRSKLLQIGLTTSHLGSNRSYNTMDDIESGKLNDVDDQMETESIAESVPDSVLEDEIIIGEDLSSRISGKSKRKLIDMEDMPSIQKRIQHTETVIPIVQSKKTMVIVGAVYRQDVKRCLDKLADFSRVAHAAPVVYF